MIMRQDNSSKDVPVRLRSNPGKLGIATGSVTGDGDPLRIEVRFGPLEAGFRFASVLARGTTGVRRAGNALIDGALLAADELPGFFAARRAAFLSEIASLMGKRLGSNPTDAAGGDEPDDAA